MVASFSLMLELLKLSPFLYKTHKLGQTLSHLCSVTERSMDAETLSPSGPIKRTGRRKPSSYKTSRRSAMKKRFSREQVAFTTLLSENPSIIVGGGLSGLLCAVTLEERGIRSTVFDTGIHGLGGRMATRVVVEFQKKLVFDHAAQFFTATDARFQKLVNKWVSEGLILEWKGVIRELDAGGRFNPIQSSTTKYIGIEGMRPLADSIHKGNNLVEITRPCWISKLEPDNGMWLLSENEKTRGSFDAIVIAHN